MAANLGEASLQEVHHEGLDEILHDLANVCPVSPSHDAKRLNVPALDAFLEIFMLKAMGPAAEQAALREQNRLDDEEMLFRNDDGETLNSERMSPSNVFFSGSFHRSKRPEPVIEISSSFSGAGKTQLLYYLVAHAILPKALGDVPVQGQDGAVVFIDADDRFDPERLRAITREIIRKSCQPLDPEDHHKNSSFLDDDIESLILSALKHVHLFRPESSSALLTTLVSLDRYLYDISGHHSESRPLQMIAIDSATAFIWVDRLRDEIARTEDIGRPHMEVERDRDLKKSFHLSDIYADIANHLRRLQNHFGSTVVFTSTVAENRPARAISELAGPPGPFEQSSSRTPSLRPPLPAPWGTYPILRLIVQRDTVRSFPISMSAHDARKEASMRQSIVQQGKFSAWVNAWGREEWPRRVLDGIAYTGSSFSFYVKESGVDIPLLQ